MKWHYGFWVMIPMALISCNSTIGGGPSPAGADSAKAITSFTFAAPYSEGLVDERTHAITVQVPLGTDVSALSPAITITGTSIEPTTGQVKDFSCPVTYVVTAFDASTQSYLVTVEQAFEDDFDRPDGAIGNGWYPILGGTGASVNLVAGRVSLISGTMALGGRADITRAALFGGNFRLSVIVNFATTTSYRYLVDIFPPGGDLTLYYAVLFQDGRLHIGKDMQVVADGTTSISEMAIGRNYRIDFMRTSSTLMATVTDLTTNATTSVSYVDDPGYPSFNAVTLENAGADNQALTVDDFRIQVP